MNYLNFEQSSYLNQFNLQPASVKGQGNLSTQYYRRILFEKLFSSFKFVIPKTCPINWFRFWLFEYGSIGVVYTKQYGWIFQPYSVTALNIYYQPSDIIVTNAYLNQTVKGKIGVNAGIIHILDDYFGLAPLVDKYAVQLAEVDSALNVNLMNSKISYLFEAESKKKAMEYKEAYKQATSGEPLVVLNSGVLNGKSVSPLLPKVKDNFIALDLMETRRAIINAFLTDVGIRNVSVQKKERLTSGETNENNDETRALVSVMEDNIRNDMESINRISGLGLGVQLRYNYNANAGIGLMGGGLQNDNRN